MARSMTGYGRNVTQHESEQLVIEIRTVNHRFLDISTHMPNEWLYLEHSIKNVMKSYFERGSVDVYIDSDQQKDKKKLLRTNWDLMDQYMDEINKAKNRYQIGDSISLDRLFQFPDVITIEEQLPQAEEWEASILNGLHDTAKKALDMRESEGKQLQTDILKQLDDVQDTVQMLRMNRDDVMQEYRERIQTRINEYLDDLSIVDENRLQQEIALLAEKGDISEELTRMESHLHHFAETIQSSGQIGRVLDFITQEMHREVNTISSKSQDAKMNQKIILMKRNIEKIKEQIQNLE